MTGPEQLTLDQAVLRLVASDIRDDLPPVVRWRKLLARVDAPPESKCSTATFRAVGHALAGYSDRHGGSCWPSVETIARDAGVGERTAQRALKALEARGLISRRIRGRAGTSLYALWIPPVGPVEKPVDDQALALVKGATDARKG